jgi:outer membrane cobalamin receptor
MKHPRAVLFPFSLALLANASALAQSEPSTYFDKGSRLEEVTVTASRREQDIQDVVGGIQVFSGAELEQKGAQDFKDYLL